METQEPLVVLHPRCCGSAVHQKEVQACLLVSEASGPARAAVSGSVQPSRDSVFLRWFPRALVEADPIIRSVRLLCER